MLKPDFHNNRIFLLRFVTTYSIFLIIILVLGLFLYHNGINDAKTRLYQQNITSLEKSIKDLDSSLLLMSTLSSQSLSDKFVRDLINRNSTEDDFYLSCVSAMNMLSSQIAIRNSLPISDSYIYLPLTNYILFTSSLSYAKHYYNHSKLYTASLYEEWLEMMNANDNIFRFLHLKHYKNESEASLLYKVPFSNFSLFQKYPGFMCFEISYTSLKNMFPVVSLIDNEFLYVTDDDGTLQFMLPNTAAVDPELDLFNTKFEQSDYYIEVEVNNEKMLLTYAASNSNGWRYYLLQSSELVFGSLIIYEKANLLIILSACIISLLLVFLLSRQSVKPILLIKSQLSKSVETQLSLQEALDMHNPIIHATYLSKIMKGLIYSKDELDGMIDFLKIHTENTKFSVLYCNIYLNENEFLFEDINREEANISEIALYRDLINNYLFEYFGTNILIYEPEFNTFAVLLSSSAEQESEEVIKSIEETFNQLHEYLIEEHSLWIYGGLGNRNADLAFTWKSYQQAVEASSYLQEGSYFQSYHYIKRDILSYYYPLELAKRLTNFITSCNEKQVREIFMILHRENIDKRTLPVNVLKWLIYDIHCTLLKVRFTVTVDKNDSDLIKEIDENLQNYKTIDLLEEIAIKLCHMFEQKPESNKIIMTIKNYISENYHDPSLSLKKISEEFSISESYFSYLFKVETKQNFSEYLEHLRMEKAMYLLKSTDINISDIYIEVGYNNVNSFRRAFKKVHGMSPTAMREMDTGG